MYNSPRVYGQYSEKSLKGLILQPETSQTSFAHTNCCRYASNDSSSRNSTLESSATVPHHCSSQQELLLLDLLVLVALAESLHCVELPVMSAMFASLVLSWRSPCLGQQESPDSLCSICLAESKKPPLKKRLPFSQ